MRSNFLSYDEEGAWDNVNKLNRRRRQHDWLGVAKFSKSEVSDKFLEGSTLIFRNNKISLQHSVG